MSRETDNASSGGQGRGGAAYPSGTPPYGTRPFPSLHPQERPRDGEQSPDAAAGPEGTPPGAFGASAEDEPKTETTLTTRVRINIPGSRPIPPVVVRRTVDGEAAAGPGAAAGSGETGSTRIPSGRASGERQPSGDPAAEALPERPEKKDKEKQANDWFAPRKPVPGQAPPPAASAPPAPAAPRAPQAPDATQPLGTGDLSGSGHDRRPPIPYLNETPGGIPPNPFPDLTGGPGGTGEYPLGLGGPDGFGGPGGTGEYPTGGPDEFGTTGPGGGQPGSGAAPDGGVPFPSGQAAGPFGSPVAGGPQAFPGEPFPNEPFPGEPFPGTAGGPGGDPFAGYQQPAGPTTGPVTGEMRMPAGPVPAGTGGPGGLGATRPPGSRAPEDTLVGGIPQMPADPAKNVTKPVPAAEPYRFQAEDEEPRPKGRSKLILLAVGVLAVVGLAYGAGLLMDHADVPAGTTVLGVDIGGKSREEAVQTLTAALGNRPSDPILLKAGSKEDKLTPSVAGLGIDVQATVSELARRDYNPISVVRSLFGGTRVADPAWVVDNDKLNAQLAGIASTSGGSGSDGMVKFVAGKAVAVPGKTHQSVDVNGSAGTIIAAYQRHVTAGGSTAVSLPVTTAQPKVTQAKLDAAVNGFGKTAMSDIVTVMADSAHSIKFGPQLSLPKFLTMVPDAQGNLVPHFDLVKMKELYGHTFDGILLQRGDGSKTAVTPQDVAGAMLPALRTSDSTKKTVTLPNVAK